VPDVQVTLKPSLRPEVFAAPNYPPLARIANIGGSVSVSFVIDAEGNTSAIAILDGHPMLQPAALDAVRAWRYAKEAASQHLEATMIFRPNCQGPH
jgi:TonB family protein